MRVETACLLARLALIPSMGAYMQVIRIEHSLLAKFVCGTFFDAMSNSALMM